MVTERKRKVTKDYEEIKMKLPEFAAKYTLNDFLWARTAVASRQFLLKIDNKLTSGLVPIADMLNHKVSFITLIALITSHTRLALVCLCLSSYGVIV